MKLPQFSLRQLLLIVTLTGFVCLLPTLAAENHGWMIAPLAALVAASLFFIAGGLAFVAAASAARFFGRASRHRQEPPRSDIS